MRREKFDFQRYQRDKTSKKINQRIFEERKEKYDWYQPASIQVGDKIMTALEAKDNTEMRFRAELYNRTSALTQKIIDDGLDYTRVTITFPTKNRVENNFYGSPIQTDNYLQKQNNSISHFVESICRRYKRSTGKTIMYKYNVEVQLKTGVNLHAHIIFYHDRDTVNTMVLCKVISDLRYSIKNKTIKKKKKSMQILSVGRLYVQIHIYHKEDIIEHFTLSHEKEVYQQLKMRKTVDKKADNYACIECNTNRKNYIPGSWVWFSFLDTDDMAQMHAEHDQYDNKAQLAHTPTELLKHLDHDTKALMQNDTGIVPKASARVIVDNINNNDWCKNYANNAILEDCNIRRIRTSKNLLFPIYIYRRCRTQLIQQDERHEEIYFTTMQYENNEIYIEKNNLYTQVINKHSGEVIAQFNTKKRSA